jgi:hypothetical protein
LHPIEKTECNWKEENKWEELDIKFYGGAMQYETIFPFSAEGVYFCNIQRKQLSLNILW